MKNSTGGAFVPFKKPPGLSIKEQKRGGAVDGGLSLSMPVGEVEPLDLSVKEPSAAFLRPPQLQQRKQRRCWSPELHKRFVDALQHLGGAQSIYPFILIPLISHSLFDFLRCMSL